MLPNQNYLGDNPLPTIESIAKSIINLDGDECYVTEIKVWQIYKAFSDHLCRFGQFETPSLEILTDCLTNMENLLGFWYYLIIPKVDYYFLNDLSLFL